MIYVFRCSEHGDFEVNQKISETTKTHQCPHCSNQCDKVLQPSNFKCAKAAGYKVQKFANNQEYRAHREKQKWM